MRKESRKIAQAFYRGERAHAARTWTDGEAVYLHNNRIAKREADGSVWLSMAGWGTVTTRERLNAICRIFGSGVGFYQRNHVQHISFPDGSVFETDPHDRWEIVAAGGDLVQSPEA